MVSIVIPAYNEEKNISVALEALVNQDTREKFEVIVVDNASTDKTIDEAKKFSKKLDLKIVNEKNKGRGIARYTGFKHAKGEIILSTDADAIVPANWVESMVSTLRASSAVAISGTLMVNDLNKFKNLTISKLFIPFMDSYKLLFGHYWLNGFSFAIWKKVYDEIGGFNPKINTQEDIEISFRVEKVGRIKLNKEAPVIFSGRRFKKGIVRGFLPYPTTYIKYFILKNEDIELPDVR